MPASQDLSRSIAPPSPRDSPRTGAVRAGIDSIELGDAPPFNLARLVVGSEGSLVIITEATVRLVPVPRAKAIAVGHFASVADAVAATEDALSAGPSAVELIDRTILALSRQKLEYAALGSILEGDPGALLFVTFDGDNAAEASASVERLAALWHRHSHGYHTLRATTPQQQAALLKVRSAGLGLLMAASEGTRRPVAFIEDTAVDPARLTDYVRRFSAALERHGLVAGFYGHCSVGCLHIRPFMDLTRPDEVTTMRTVAAEIRDLVSEFGGANSSEHGDGLARSEFNRIVFGDALYAAMCELKLLFDPHALMNPGKIVNAPPMSESIRDVALAPAFDLSTRLSFKGTGGMRGAADRCMNIGVCRKGSTGVMCPSYMATREEEHSTRGRANALVLALSQPDPRAALGDDRLHDILDLCLECKACKSECPLGVDMASLKSEFLFHYQGIHGVPARARFFAAARTLNRAGVDARAGLQPGHVIAGIACADGANPGGHAKAAAATIPPADAAAVECAPAAAATSRVPGTCRDACRLVHHVHGTGGWHRGGGTAGAGRMAGRADRRSLLRTRRHLQGAS